MKNNMTVAQQKALVADALEDINHVRKVIEAYFSENDDPICPTIRNEDLRAFRESLNRGFCTLYQAIKERFPE